MSEQKDQQTTTNQTPAPDPMAQQEPSGPDVRRFRRVSLQVSVELGRGKLKIRDLMALRHQSIVELKRAAGSNLDIRVNGLLLGKGEPVIHESRVGIQIHEIVDSEN
jgi:flagellar motor switch protein FliN/FliY